MTLFVRLLDTPAEDKGRVLQRVAGSYRADSEEAVISIDATTFRALPDSPFLYYMPQPVLKLASEGSNLGAKRGAARQGFGAATRFHRLRWEVPEESIGEGKRFLHMAHGTPPRSFWKASDYVCMWGEAGREAKADVAHRYPYLKGNYGFKIQAEDYYGRPGLCYGKRTGHFTAQVLPAGHIFSFEGTAIHLETSVQDHWALLGIANSAPFRAWLNAACAQHKTYTYVNQAPLPRVIPERMGELALQGWLMAYSHGTASQTAHSFVAPAIVQAAGETLASRIEDWSRQVVEHDVRVAQNAREIDELALELYGIGEGQRLTRDAIAGAGGHGAEDEVDEGEAVVVDPLTLIESFLDWTLGVALGRFDVRIATGDIQLRPDPGPFDSLPLSSPGMLQGEQGLPAVGAPDGYGLDLPPHGVLVDDPGHPWDAVTRMERVVDLVSNLRGAEWIQEAEALLGRDLRDWLRRYGFERHLKRYSRRRRKAPLFWHFAPRSRTYGIWLYSPVATRDSIYRILNDYVNPKLKATERVLIELRHEGGDSPTTQQRRDLGSQEALVGDLRAFREELTRVATLWAPHRDDGVALNCAPLWRLFDHHRAWQKECKTKWGELAKGKYDWASWAMHLWPERVVGSCAKDRSIAIAHGLEEALWVEGDDGKWTPRDDGKERVVRLVEERRSPAIEAALDDFTKSG